jgi:hypothetical protein
MKPAMKALLLAAVCLPTLISPADVLAGDAIDTRESGVVCDANQQLCFDRGGLALDATQRNFGRSGEKKARRLINQGKAGPTFKLSNGVACDITVRTCWDDGWKRRNVAKTMTRHLFNAAPQSGNTPWGSGGTGGGYSGECLLRQGGRTVFEGSCQLREQGDGRERRFIATMRNGARYIFQNQGGNVWISDGRGGQWPVKHRDYGQAAVFRWADMSLEARQGAYRGSPSDRNRSLEDLLRQMFN